MKLGKVEKKSIRYALVKQYFGFVFNKIFYKRVIYQGVENIPKDKPVMLAPNHQNALMDALALVFSAKRTIIFLARSDIFVNKFVSGLLFFFRILPVYRIRDGKEKLKLNEAIFQKTVEVLEKNKTVTIFPEAQHIDKRHLRTLKKGVQRVAFAAAEKNNYDIDIQIVPVGIYYSNYWNFRTILQVNYGKPIAVKDFYELHKENPAKAMTALRDRMSEEIKKQMLDIRNLENHDTIEDLREICDVPMMKAMRTQRFVQKEKFKADKKIIELAENYSKNEPEAFEQLKQKTDDYTEGLEKYGLSDWSFEKQADTATLAVRALGLLAGFPIWLYGTINNIIPAILPIPVKRNLKDRQFESSFVYGLGAISFPVFYLLQTAIVLWLTGSWLAAGAYLISLPLTGLFAFTYSRFYNKFLRILHFVKLKGSSQIKILQVLRRQIIETMLELYRKQKDSAQRK
jgi:1-acyl-sn-glycerol-3-phosphate acyltransferase